MVTSTKSRLRVGHPGLPASSKQLRGRVQIRMTTYHREDTDQERRCYPYRQALRRRPQNSRTLPMNFTLVSLSLISGLDDEVHTHRGHDRRHRRHQRHRPDRQPDYRFYNDSGQTYFLRNGSVPSSRLCEVIRTYYLSPAASLLAPPLLLRTVASHTSMSMRIYPTMGCLMDLRITP
jgi:hypothetical protein